MATEAEGAYTIAREFVANMASRGVHRLEDDAAVYHLALLVQCAVTAERARGVSYCRAKAGVRDGGLSADERAARRAESYTQFSIADAIERGEHCARFSPPRLAGQGSWGPHERAVQQTSVRIRRRGRKELNMATKHTFTKRVERAALAWSKLSHWQRSEMLEFWEEEARQVVSDDQSDIDFTIATTAAIELLRAVSP